VKPGLKALTRETPVKTEDPQTRKASLNNTFKVLIAFALIERNENDEASSTSERSSRSVDTAQDHLDVLRIHGIVQAFFVDVLADRKLAHYWLIRAIHVFCRAYDESDHRIQEDSSTGTPQDYRRFEVHGRKLSGFLDRFERKYPELSDVRDLLEQRLDGIQVRIDLLNKRKATDKSYDEEQIVSVFERTNSLSEVDSSTPPSSSSLVHIGMYDEDNMPMESPLPYSPTDQHNPYHWHVTFPYGMAPPEDGDYSPTVTPQPAPTELFESISVPEDYQISQPAETDHRTVRRHSERRYRDTVGAWRAAPQILSDPRISLSREVVKGVISPPSTTGQRAEGTDGAPSDRGTANSDAEMRLNKITKAASFPLKGAVAQDDAPPTDSLLAARPKLIPGRPSYSDAHAKEALENDQPTATFSSTLGTASPPSASYTAATLLRLKEQGDKPISTDGLSPVKVSSPLSAGPLTTMSGSPILSPQPPLPSLTEVPDVLDASSQHGSRTSSGQPARSARSSPLQMTGPFSPPPIPIEVHHTSSLRSVPASGPGMEGAIYSRPEDFVGPIYEDEYEPMTHSTHSLPSVRPYPSSRPPSPPYPHVSPLPQPVSVSIHPPGWTASEGRLEYHPRGYWSQPMSRDPSHQSTNSLGSTHSQPLRNRSPLMASTSMQGVGSSASSPGVQAMQRPQSRRPSVVETEPSPLLGAAGFEMEPTSYQIYHDSVRGRLRTGSIVYPAQVVHVVPGTAERPGFFRRFSRRRRGTAAMQQRRAGSASGRLTREDLVNRSPDLMGTGGAFRTSPSIGTGSGEEMARSASGGGGFKLDDGTFVEFGSSATSGERSDSQQGNVGLGLY
jgi:hypothetical protein